MFGWEFPPHNSGGLGVACEGLVRALLSQGEEVIFVLPKKLEHTIQETKTFKIRFADQTPLGKKMLTMKTHAVNVALSPYLNPATYGESLKWLLARLQKNNKNLYYSSTLFGEVLRYGELARHIAETEQFDVIHAHDWLSFPAAIIAKQVSRKPLVVHVHATEFDRSGGKNITSSNVAEIEKEGLEQADAIVTVSALTKNNIAKHYNIIPEKITVVHNAIEYADIVKHGTLDEKLSALRASGKKIVLFLGRITIQKGPDYFIRTAAEVVKHYPNVVFVFAGSGDMEIQMIELAAKLGIANKMIFTGFLRGKDNSNAYKMADLYVLPSVSEPFGLTVLESLINGTPALISKTSGVSEVLSHALKVDFWDIKEMTNKIVAVLENPELCKELRANGFEEAKRFSWKNSAKKCMALYRTLTHKK